MDRNMIALVCFPRILPGRTLVASFRDRSVFIDDDASMNSIIELAGQSADMGNSVLPSMIASVQFVPPECGVV